MGRKIKWKNSIYRRNKYKSDFQHYETISFGESIYCGKETIDDTEEDQSNLLKNIVELNEKSRPRIKESIDKKEILMKLHMIFMKGENIS